MRGVPEIKQIGFIQKTKHFQGEVILQHRIYSASVFEKDTPLFVQLAPDYFIPYFVATARALDTQSTQILFEGVDSIELAKKCLLSKNVFVDMTTFNKYVNSRSPLFWIDKIFSYKKQVLGKVVDVLEQNKKILLQIENEEKQEIFFPFYIEELPFMSSSI